MNKMFFGVAKYYVEYVTSSGNDNMILTQSALLRLLNDNTVKVTNFYPIYDKQFLEGESLLFFVRFESNTWSGVRTIIPHYQPTCQEEKYKKNKKISFLKQVKDLIKNASKLYQSI